MWEWQAEEDEEGKKIVDPPPETLCSWYDWQSITDITIKHFDYEKFIHWLIPLYILMLCVHRCIIKCCEYYTAFTSSSHLASAIIISCYTCIFLNSSWAHSVLTQFGTHDNTMEEALIKKKWHQLWRDEGARFIATQRGFNLFAQCRRK